jgi:phosphatidate cytidylyltransferase
MVVREGHKAARERRRVANRRPKAPGGGHESPSENCEVSDKESAIKQGQPTNLLKRVVSAAVLLPTVYFLAYIGGWWALAFLAFALGAAIWEYVGLLRHLGYRPLYVFALAMPAVVLLSFSFTDVGMLEPAVAVLLLASLCWTVLWDRSQTKVENWLLPLAGAFYVSWMGGHLVLVRTLDRGEYWVLVVLALPMLADTAAYFVGGTWGRHPMAPKVSPKKTWEGLGAGVIVATVAGTLFFGLVGLGWAHGVVLGLLLSTLPVFGDLGVSVIKRQVGVKDSGNLIPGHGGALDRVDSLLVAAAIGYYYIHWAMGVSPLG